MVLFVNCLKVHHFSSWCYLLATKQQKDVMLRLVTCDFLGDEPLERCLETG